MVSSCGKCNDPDNDVMVACDICSAWFHYECVGESPGVENREFRCDKCIVEKKKRVAQGSSTVPKTSSSAPKNSIIPPTSGDGHDSKISSYETGNSTGSSGSITSGSRIDVELRRMEEALRLAEKQMEEEKLIEERQLEIDRILKQKKMQHEHELRKRRMEQEEEMLAKQLADEQNFLDRRRAMCETFEKEQEKIRIANELVNSAVGGMLRLETTEKQQNAIVPTRSLGAVPKLNLGTTNVIPSANPAGPETPKRNPEILPPKTKTKVTEKELSDSSSSESDSEESIRSIANYDSDKETPVKLRSKSVKEKGPSKAQRAARQILPKKLPRFTGRPEEWPLFYSSFINSTEACGFSQVENLVRLHECLAGPALDSVRSRLLLPQAVPQVIETLRMLYGRPEQLVHTLLNSVRKVTPPKADRLETFIPFGMAVQELCDHLEAAELNDHLVNPILIQELIDKLPAGTKREWVQFKHCQDPVTLRTFANFATKIVAEASEVTLMIDSTAGFRSGTVGQGSMALASHPNVLFRVHYKHPPGNTSQFDGDPLPYTFCYFYSYRQLATDIVKVLLRCYANDFGGSGYVA